jgi:hypothetical protein
MELAAAQPQPFAARFGKRINASLSATSALTPLFAFQPSRLRSIRKKGPSEALVIEPQLVPVLERDPPAAARRVARQGLAVPAALKPALPGPGQVVDEKLRRKYWAWRNVSRFRNR